MTTTRKTTPESSPITANRPVGGEYRTVQLSSLTVQPDAHVSQAKISTGVVVGGQYKRSPDGKSAVYVSMDAMALPRKLAVERLNAELRGTAIATTSASPKKPRG